MVFGRVAEAVTALLILMFGMVIWAAVSRRRVRQHLVLARKQHIDLARVLDGVNAGLLRVRMAPDGAVVRMFVNSGTARILRLPTAVCDPDFEILALAEPPMALEAMAEVRAELHGAGFSSFELRLRCGDGEVRWMRFAIQIGRAHV